MSRFFLAGLCLASLFSLPDRAFAAVRTWSGAAANDNWTTPANWVENDAPDPGDSLVFPIDSPGDSVNNFPVDTEFVTLTLSDTHRITGNRFKLAGGIVVANVDPGDTVEITCDILLRGSIVDVRAITFDVEEGALLWIKGVIHGSAFATLRKDGDGNAWLFAENAYLGNTAIARGLLGALDPGALGSTSNATTVLPGGRLSFGLPGGGTVAEPLVLTGGPDVSAGIEAYHDVTLTGTVTVQGTAPPTVRAAVDTVITFWGVIAGPQGVSFAGRGTTVMSGLATNSYQGTTTVRAGTLMLDKPPGLAAIPGDLVIGGTTELAKGVVTLQKTSQIQGSVTVSRDSLLDLNGHSDTIGALTLAGGRVKTGAGTLTLGGDVTVLESPPESRIEGKLSLGLATRTFDVSPGQSLYIPAIIGAPLDQGIVKRGTGTVYLSGPNTYAGPTTVVQGTLTATDPLAFGSPAAGTNLGTSGHILLGTNVTGEPLAAVSEPSSDGPKLESMAPSARTWGGPITISGRLTAEASLYSYSATLRLTGVISGNGELITNGTSVEIGGANTYAGDTTVGSRLIVTGYQRLPATSRVHLHNTWNLNGFNHTIGGVSGSGSALILLGGAKLTVVSRAGIADVFAGTIGEMGILVKEGTGTWELTGVSNSPAPLTIIEGTVRVTGSMASDVTLAGGTLEGTGHVGKIGGPSGTVRPGASPGVLHSRSLAELGAGVSMEVEIAGPAAGSQYSQFDVTGSVNLGAASLALGVAPDFLPESAADFIIIDNDGADPVVGTFNGLPEGAVVEAKGGKKFRITYAGGTGNDVVLTAQSESRYYLSEGATGSFFDLDVLIANPTGTDAPVTLTFLREDGGVVSVQRTVPGMQRITVRVDDIAGVEDTPVSTVVTSDNGSPLIVERTMRWDQSGYGAHTEKAAGGTALTWYFAEGSQGFFSTYLLLANPGTSPSTATVQYLREGMPALTRSYPIAAGSRFTVNAGADPELVNTSFGMTVTFDRPGIAERAMYFGGDPVWKGGHESAGVTAPSLTWFLAEGATGPFFETFVLLANPNGADAEATLTFLTSGGAPIVKSKTVPANGRLTVNIESEDPALANAPVSTKIDATQPVIVERAQYWPDPAPVWYEAHNSFGITAAGTKWGLAEGRSGGGDAAYQTYILIANPGASAAEVTITFLLEGGAPVAKTFNVPPASRFNVSTGEGTMVPEVQNQRFGAVLTSDQPIVVERAMYSNAGGQTWAAGTNATATRLP